MQLTLECQGVTLVATDQSWFESLSPESKLVVDLRKVTEITSLPDLKEKGIKRVSIPLTPDTWSEQDMDALRREFLRGESPVVVVSTGGQRAALMVLQHVARALQWNLEDALGKSAEVANRPELKTLLQDYLQRHQRPSS